MPLAADAADVEASAQSPTARGARAAGRAARRRDRAHRCADQSARLTARAAALHAGGSTTAEHVVRGVERELEKDGRRLPPRERAQLLGG